MIVVFLDLKSHAVSFASIKFDKTWFGCISCQNVVIGASVIALQCLLFDIHWT